MIQVDCYQAMTMVFVEASSDSLFCLIEPANKVVFSGTPTLNLEIVFS